MPELLKEEEWSAPEETMESLDEIKKAAMRAADLTRQLLAFSRKQVMELKVLELGGLLVDSEKMLRRVIGEDIELRTNYASAAKIRADRGQLNQVIMNLAVNARDAMPNGGTLTLETADWEANEHYARTHPVLAPAAMLRSSSRIPASGCRQELVEQIFEPFFTTKEPGNGTGLGLSTVYGIIKQSGGAVTMESCVDQGTSVSIYLPRARAVPGSDTPAQPCRRPPKGGFASCWSMTIRQCGRPRRKCWSNWGTRLWRCRMAPQPSNA